MPSWCIVLAPLGMNKTGVFQVSKPNDTVQLCLDPARLNQALIRPIDRGPTINDILPNLTNAHSMTIIDVN